MSPISGTGLFSADEAICKPLRFDVLPWSVAIPLVVYRLICSMERKPSRTASLMSFAVTSFWKSTNAFIRLWSFGVGNISIIAPVPKSQSPEHPPTQWAFSFGRSGTYAPRSSRHFRLPLLCDHKCTLGVQPPAINRASVSIRRTRWSP